MEKTIRMELDKHKVSAISKVLKENLFELDDDAWVYADDNGQAVMSITYKVEENEIVYDIWMLDEEMQILLDKVFDEIEKAS